MAIKRNLRIGGIEIKKQHIVSLAVGILTAILSLIFLSGTDLLYLILGIAFVIAGFPFFISIITETSVEKEKEMMFLEFSKNLVESVKMGTPISRSILNVRTKNYGSLNPHIEKLANQISIGIPVNTAFETFARDIGNPVILRAVSIIRESERAGGQIEDILDSVARSVSQVDKLKKERSAAMHTLVVQGYIIFLIFIVIMLVMQFKILPITSGLGGVQLGETHLEQEMHLGEYSGAAAAEDKKQQQKN
jgi:flagellar protein FlaJ